MSSSRRREVLSPVLTPNLEHTPHNGFVSPSTSRHVPICSPAALLTTERDDKKEKMDRRRSRVLELQNKNLGSPLSPAERRKSLPLSGLTAAQLSEHYASCIKLSAENKINSKNAFGLHLIDYMSELLKKKELENFQVASSTLDASAKIYAGRVDAIHAETFKVLSGLGRGSDKPKESDEAEGDEEQKEGQTEQDDEGSQKKKRKIRKSKTVETNLKNINVNKLDLAIEVDPTFQLMSAAFDEGGTSGLLMNNLRCFDDSQELVLDSTTIVSHTDTNTLSQQSQQSRKMVDLLSIQDMFKGVDINSLQVCEAFSSFTFTNWDGSDTSSLCIPGSKDHVFDMDAETEPIPETTEPNLTMIGGGDGSFSSDGDNDAEAPHINQEETMESESQYIGDGKAAQLVQSALSNLTHSTTGSLMQVLATTPSDYSYFNKALLRAWAGPSHWKIGPVSRDSKLKSMNTTDKPKTKKAAFRMNFDVELDFEHQFKISKATCITKGTLSKYSKELTTLPKDHHYDADKLFRLFLRKKIMIKRQEENTQAVDDVIDNYDYDNENDKENYCPNKLDGGDDDDDSVEFNFTAEGNEFSSSLDMFSKSQHNFAASTTLDGTILAGDKLLAQPYKVAKIDIEYAKTAKKLDVKRLKSTMWNVLTKHESSPEEAQNVNNNSLEAEKRLTGFVREMTGSCTFQELLTDLPSKLSGQTAHNLSVPIAFVCLLHLANEKTLKLEDLALDDLRITQGL
ncbi:hypothetical protein CHS0354_041175 [Potamilus streckersoni]|uniref:Condensin complex subunit 2 n=1 Tax=Potamilus streckersoni TaxID=2493646 RepID=A0AAE0SF24_9BIVA|nr:hypothetical protein CHS0354_041175 [Potamilus streckersoni]